MSRVRSSKSYRAAARCPAMEPRCLNVRVDTATSPATAASSADDREDRDAIADLLAARLPAQHRRAAASRPCWPPAAGRSAAGADAAHLLLALRRLDEQDVGAGASRRPRRGAAPRRGRARVRASVRAMMRKSRDRRDSTATRILLHHVVHRDHAPARRVAALLGQLLVLELDRAARPRPRSRAPCAHVEQAAVAGVAVGDQRRARPCSPSAARGPPCRCRWPAPRRASPRCEATVPKPVMYSASKPNSSAMRSDTMSCTPGATTRPGCCRRWRSVVLAMAGMATMFA